jgi:hypothetical protein
MEDECAITHEPEESPTVRYRLLIGLMRVLLGAEADYGGSAGASPYQDHGIMAARREPRPYQDHGIMAARREPRPYRIRFRSPNSCQR